MSSLSLSPPPQEPPTLPRPKHTDFNAPPARSSSGELFSCSVGRNRLDTDSRVSGGDDFEVSVSHAAYPQFSSGETPKKAEKPVAPLGAELLLTAAFSALGTLVRQSFLLLTKHTPGWHLSPLPLFDALWPNFVGSVLSSLFLPLPKLLATADERRGKKCRRQLKRHRGERRREESRGNGDEEVEGREAKIQASDVLPVPLASFSENLEKEIPMDEGSAAHSQPLEVTVADGVAPSGVGLPAWFSQLPRHPLRSFSASSRSREHKDCHKEEEHSRDFVFPILVALPVALSKGFCASLTTFSSWILALLQALWDAPDTHAALSSSAYSRGNRFIWVALFGISTPIFAFHLGTDAGLLLQRLVLHRRPRLWTFSDALRESREASRETKHRHRGKGTRERKRAGKHEQGDGMDARGAARKDQCEGNEDSHLFSSQQRKDQRGRTSSEDVTERHSPDSQSNGGAVGIEIPEEIRGDKMHEVHRNQPRSAAPSVLDVSRPVERGEGEAKATNLTSRNPGAVLADSMSLGTMQSRRRQRAEEMRSSSSSEGGELLRVACELLLCEAAGQETRDECMRQKGGYKVKRGSSNTRRTWWSRRVFERFVGSSKGEKKATLVAALVAAAVYAILGCLARFDTDATRQNLLWYPPVLSFVGAWLRYTLSWQLDVYTPYFPMGTFLSNVVASVLVASTEILLHREYPECRGQSASKSPRCTDVSYFLVEAVVYGICSSLSTMSTFVAELSILPKRYAYRYGLVTLICAFGFAAAVYAALK
ncbi:UNVERIFIED_CONTAM: CrcB family protein [Hammondia hammondi]|eukprot:XP_008882362.1 CrcB family protein [Hammondia hammondi]